MENQNKQMKSQKLISEELEKLQKFQTQNNQITNSLGQIEIQKQVLESQKIDILQQLSKLQEESSELSKELQEKYGNGSVDIETGEFTSED
jgi:hypothetical protein